MLNNIIPQHRNVLLIIVMLFFWTVALLSDGAAQTRPQWKAHDLNRPRPSKVTPAPQETMVPPPSDATILFDGADLKKWCSEDGGPAPWHIKDGAMIPIGKGEDIYTVQPFGDVQLHVEWAAPMPPRGEGQGRGNSGVFLMGLYEVQILDSFDNETYADGQAAAVYGQYPPLANACRPPGAWQTYDIMFRRPRFRPDGTLSEPAKMTVIHNGILVQDAVRLWGPTMWLQHLPYKSHPRKLPISLQDHGNPVRFRNIWVRELREWEEPGPGPYDTPPVINLTGEVLKRYVGTYRYGPDSESAFEITSDGQSLQCIFGKKQGKVDLVPHSLRKFSMRWTAAHVEFDLDDEGEAEAITFHVAGSSFKVKKQE